MQYKSSEYKTSITEVSSPLFVVPPCNTSSKPSLLWQIGLVFSLTSRYAVHIFRIVSVYVPRYVMVDVAMIVFSEHFWYVCVCVCVRACEHSSSAPSQILYLFFSASFVLPSISITFSLSLSSSLSFLTLFPAAYTFAQPSLLLM